MSIRNGSNVAREDHVYTQHLKCSFRCVYTSVSGPFFFFFFELHIEAAVQSLDRQRLIYLRKITYKTSISPSMIKQFHHYLIKLGPTTHQKKKKLGPTRSGTMLSIRGGHGTTKFYKIFLIASKLVYPSSYL